MSLQVISRKEIPGGSLSVEFLITSRQASSLNTVLSLAGIQPKTFDTPYGWAFDSHTGTAMITMPWGYRGKIDAALKMLQRKWYPKFQTAEEMKNGGMA